MNIYGDQKTCKMCKARADIVEKGKDYCADCYSLTVWKMPLDKVNKDLDRREGIKLKVVTP
tara:strand:+ start:210 stop:392 length:183 start_codon:yes stop_codon:yes gene_type:complete